MHSCNRKNLHSTGILGKNLYILGSLQDKPKFWELSKFFFEVFELQVFFRRNCLQFSLSKIPQKCIAWPTSEEKVLLDRYFTETFIDML